MFLDVRSKPDTANIQPEKYISISEKFIPVELCNELKEYIDTSTKTHRRGSKTPDTVEASFSTCLILETNRPLYKIFDALIIEYNKKHNFAIDFIEPLELKKYEVDDCFGPHRDNYVATESGLDRKLNIIAQLSDKDDYDGGDLILGYYKKIILPKTLGTVIIFPSNYLHQVSKITRGSRYSLIGHVWGPEFK